MIPPGTVFMGCEYLRNVGAEWSRKHWKHYKIYLIFKGVKLLEGIGFANGTGLYIAPDCFERDSAEVQEEVVVPQSNSSNHEIYTPAIPNDQYCGTCA